MCSARVVRVHIENRPQALPVGVGDHGLEQHATDAPLLDCWIDEQTLHDGERLGSNRYVLQPQIERPITVGFGECCVPDRRSAGESDPAPTGTRATDENNRVLWKVHRVAASTMNSLEHTCEWSEVGIGEQP
jgi:hypothetical protein